LRAHSSVEVDRRDRDTWRMPPLNMLSGPLMSTGRKAGLAVLRGYLAIAMILVVVRIIQMAFGHLARPRGPVGRRSTDRNLGRTTWVPRTRSGACRCIAAQIEGPTLTSPQRDTIPLCPAMP
jgi:hypothetical protein